MIVDDYWLGICYLMSWWILIATFSIIFLGTLLALKRFCYVYKSNGNSLLMFPESNEFSYIKSSICNIYSKLMLVFFHLKQKMRMHVSLFVKLKTNMYQISESPSLSIEL